MKKPSKTENFIYSMNHGPLSLLMQEALADEFWKGVEEKSDLYIEKLAAQLEADLDDQETAEAVGAVQSLAKCSVKDAYLAGFDAAVKIAFEYVREYEQPAENESEAG